VNRQLAEELRPALDTADTTLACRECGTEFVYTAGEQAFYVARGFVPPNRCPDCRRRRHAERQALRANSPYATADGGRGPRPLFAAVCADCGCETKVPFEPKPGRPVYCRQCFAVHRETFRA